MTNYDEESRKKGRPTGQWWKKKTAFMVYLYNSTPNDVLEIKNIVKGINARNKARTSGIDVDANKRKYI